MDNVVDATASATTEEVDSTALVARPAGQGAPAANELTSSADEAEDDDEKEFRLVGNRLIRFEELEVTPGGWAVLHGLRSQPQLNGLLVRVCGWERPRWWPEAESSVDIENCERIHVELVDATIPGSDTQNRQITPRLQNLQAVRPEDALGRLIHAWLDAGPSESTFAVPVWEALGRSGDEWEALRKRERALVHSMCQDICDKLGVQVAQVHPNDRLTPRGDPRRQVKLQLVSAQASADDVSSHAAISAGATGDMRSLPFVELCKLLEALEAVDETKKARR